MGSHFGTGEFTTHFRTYFSDWDVHWGTIWVLTHGHLLSSMGAIQKGRRRQNDCLPTSKSSKRLGLKEDQQESLQFDLFAFGFDSGGQSRSCVGGLPAVYGPYAKSWTPWTSMREGRRAKF